MREGVGVEEAEKMVQPWVCSRLAMDSKRIISDGDNVRGNWKTYP